MTTQAVTLSKERQDHLRVVRTMFRLLERLGTELTAKTEGLDHRGVLYSKEIWRTVAAFLAHETVLP